MRNVLKTLLLFTILIGIGAFISSCGHGDDANPYETEWIGGMNTDALDGEPSEFSSIKELAEATIQGMAEDMVSKTFDIIDSMDIDLGRKRENNSRYLSYSSIEYEDISLNMEDENGGTIYMYGIGSFVKNRPQRCVLLANYANDYSFYSYLGKTSYIEEAAMLGNSEIRYIATSYSCNFNSDMNLDVIMVGAVAVNGITVNALEFTADHRAMVGTDIVVKSAVVNTAGGTYYCRTYNTGGVLCTSANHNTYDFEGMTGCSNSFGTVRQECDLDADDFFSGERTYGDRVVRYDFHLKCSESGIWTPPCVVGGSSDMCPYDSVCRQSEDFDWGPGLEGYGYCSCD